MGRKEACRNITAESVILEMREADIALFKVKKDDVAEESRAAYKDIEDVMAHQSDLVQPDVRLTPLGVVKG
jgi:tRNA-splicing ligase RtcB